MEFQFSKNSKIWLLLQAVLAVESSGTTFVFQGAELICLRCFAHSLGEDVTLCADLLSKDIISEIECEYWDLMHPSKRGGE